MSEFTATGTSFTPVGSPVTALSPLPEQMLDAFLKVDHKRVLSLIGRMSPQDAEWRDQDGNTLLHWAICRDDTVAALRILEKASPHALTLKNAMGEMALGVAAWRANPQVIFGLKQRMPAEAFESERAGCLRGVEEDKRFLGAYPRLSPSERDHLECVEECIELFQPEEAPRSFRQRLLGALGCKV